MIVQVRAKVRLITEDDLMLEDLDLGIKSQSEWGIRTISIPGDEIYKLVSYAKNKTLIQMYDKEYILAYEPHTEISEKWNRALKSVNNPHEPEEEEENNEQDENIDDEEKS